MCCVRLLRHTNDLPHPSKGQAWSCAARFAASFWVVGVMGGSGAIAVAALGLVLAAVCCCCCCWPWNECNVAPRRIAAEKSGGGNGKVGAAAVVAAASRSDELSLPEMVVMAVAAEAAAEGLVIGSGASIAAVTPFSPGDSFGELSPVATGSDRGKLVVPAGGCGCEEGGEGRATPQPPNCCRCVFRSCSTVDPSVAPISPPVGASTAA